MKQDLGVREDQERQDNQILSLEEEIEHWPRRSTVVNGRLSLSNLLPGSMPLGTCNV